MVIIMTDEQQIELRPFPPFLPPHASVLMMGSFPPAAEKRTMEFHYPNFQNDAEKIKAFLTERGIASCPGVRRAIRTHGNASDAYLKVVETVELPEILEKIPQCRRICTTGGKATEILLSLLETEVRAKDFKTGETIAARCGDRDLLITRLPSTSRAYPMKLEAKAEVYRKFFVEAGFAVA